VNRRAFTFLALAVALLAGSGCAERTADVGHPHAFDDVGLSFSYPGNWTVSVDKGESFRTVELETPGNALGLVMEFRPAIDVDLDSFAKRTMEGMKRHVDEKGHGVFDLKILPRTASRRKLLGEPRDGFHYAFSIGAGGEDLPHGADIWGAKLPERTVVVWMQTADEDRSKVQPGFDQVLDSMRAKP
jgi:hypothetical protein